MAHVASDTAEAQVAKGSAFIGTPADIVEMIRSFNGKVGGLDSISLHFTPSQHAGRCGGALAAAVRARGDAEGVALSRETP